MRVLIIANPIAGGGHGQAMGEALQKALQMQGLDAELYLTRCKGDGVQAAQQGGYDCVVSVGGDGSASDVANGLVGTDIPLAIQPLGTANVVARELGLPSEPDAVAALIAAGESRAIDMGVMNDTRFIMGAGAGFDAAVVAYVDAHRGKRLGYLGWVWPAIHEVFAYSYPRFRVEVDGEEVCAEAQYAIVGNCRYSAGMFRFTPEAQVDDGLFDVCIFPKVGLFRLIRLALASFRSGFAQRSDLIYRKGKNVVMTPLEGGTVPAQRDGDTAGTLPAAFRIEPAAFRVIVPGNNKAAGP